MFHDQSANSSGVFTLSKSSSCTRIGATFLEERFGKIDPNFYFFPQYFRYNNSEDTD